MERLTIILIALFIILFIGQMFSREYFVAVTDMSNSTITMSLSDLLYTIGIGAGSSSGSGSGSYSTYKPPVQPQDNLEQYLLTKQDFLNEFKTGLDKSLPSLLANSSGSYAVPPSSMTDVSPSCSQGSGYMEQVALTTQSLNKKACAM